MCDNTTCVMSMNRKNKNEIDWDAAMVSLSEMPQDQHAPYLAMLTFEKKQLKTSTDEARTKVVALEAKVEKATSSKVRDKANEAKSSSRAKSAKKKAVSQKKAKINGVIITFHQYSMLQTVRDLVNNGVNGAEGLSSTEIAEYRECGETGGDCSTVLDRLKAHGLIDWRLVEVSKKSGKEQSWPSRNFPSSTKRRQFVLLG